nr:monothiol glutaredoxin-S1-like [Ipomoea batatas]
MAPYETSGTGSHIRRRTDYHRRFEYPFSGTTKVRATAHGKQRAFMSPVFTVGSTFRSPQMAAGNITSLYFQPSNMGHVGHNTFVDPHKLRPISQPNLPNPLFLGPQTKNSTGSDQRKKKKSQHAGDDFQSWLRTALDVFSKEQFSTLSIVCWHIWNLRNNLIWNNHAIESVDNLIFKSKSYYAAWITATKDDSHNKVPVSPNSKWEKPQHGLVKLNVDAAINEIGGCMGTGCVLRNDGGMFMAARGANMRVTGKDKHPWNEWIEECDRLLGFRPPIEVVTMSKIYATALPPVLVLNGWHTDEEISTTSANLTAHRLMGYVDGSISPPPATLPIVTEGTTATPTITIPNPDFEVWSIIDAQLCACLLAIISSSVKNNLHGLTSAATIWSHLQLWYNSLSRIHIFLLKEQLHNIQKGGDSMQKYLDSIVKIVAALDHAKSAIPEQDVISVCFGAYHLNTPPSNKIFERIFGSSISTPQAFDASQSANSNENWFLDAGANAHVTPDLSRLYSQTPYSGTETVTSADMDMVMKLGAEMPVVIFSKSTCCISHSIETLIRGFGANPKVHQLDEVANGKQMERALVELGCIPSTPAVFLGKVMLGGSNEIITLNIKGKLKQLLIDANAIWV